MELRPPKPGYGPDEELNRLAERVIGYKGKKAGEGRIDKAAGKPLGLLINFNVPVLKDGIKRIAN